MCGRSPAATLSTAAEALLASSRASPSSATALVFAQPMAARSPTATSLIHLEKKSKINGLGTKFSAYLSSEEVGKILEGDTTWMLEADNSLIQELYIKMRYQGLRPTTIVDYTREPFIYAPGNVRVTFDYDIRTGLDHMDFLNMNCVTVPAGDAPIIMEVKWDAYLPAIIRNLVQEPGVRSGSFSKYAQCRVYG